MELTTIYKIGILTSVWGNWGTAYRLHRTVPSHIAVTEWLYMTLKKLLNIPQPLSGSHLKNYINWYKSTLETANDTHMWIKRNAPASTAYTLITRLSCLTIPFIIYFLKFHFSLLMFVLCVWVYHSTHGEATGQLVGVSSLLPPHGAWGSNPGHQTWWWVSLPTEPLHCPHPLFPRAEDGIQDLRPSTLPLG